MKKLLCACVIAVVGMFSLGAGLGHGAEEAHAEAKVAETVAIAEASVPAAVAPEVEELIVEENDIEEAYTEPVVVKEVAPELIDMVNDIKSSTEMDWAMHTEKDSIYTFVINGRWLEFNPRYICESQNSDINIYVADEYEIILNQATHYAIIHYGDDTCEDGFVDCIMSSCAAY